MDSECVPVGDESSFGVAGHLAHMNDQTRVPAGVPSGGEFATSPRAEAELALSPARPTPFPTPGTPPGTHLDTTMAASDLVTGAFSPEWDSLVSGVEPHLDAARIAEYAALPPSSAPPLHVCLPVPGEEPEPMLLDGHHRLFAAARRGDLEVAVRLHSPVVDADGIAEYPSLPARLGGDGAEAEADVANEALEFATDYCEAAGGARPGMCHPAAWNVEIDFGWPLVRGTRDGRAHYWNEMPDGRIFDPTAAQFDGHDGPLITDGDDARYVRSR